MGLGLGGTRVWGLGLGLGLGWCGVWCGEYPYALRLFRLPAGEVCEELNVWRQPRLDEVADGLVEGHADVVEEPDLRQT